MACTIVNDLPNPPLGVAIRYDSISAVQALAAGETRNRGDLQAEILFLAHQLLLKGSDVFLMWLPSHTGIRGNELADKEAKETAKDGTAVVLKLSLTEIKSATHRAARKIREEFLKQRCETHGWLFLPGGQTRQPQLSRRALQALRRTLTVSARCTHVAPKCQCGTDISLHHALTGSMALAPSLFPSVGLQEGAQAGSPRLFATAPRPRGATHAGPDSIITHLRDRAVVLNPLPIDNQRHRLVQGRNRQDS